MKVQHVRIAGAIVFATMVAAVLSGTAVAANGLQELSNAFAEVSGEVKPAVVSVISEKDIDAQSNPRNMQRFFEQYPFFREFFDRNLPQFRQRQPRRPITGLGSGVIIDGDKGYVLTNNHVVDGADRLKVRTSDDQQYDAEVKGRDPKTDVAVIQIADLDRRLPEADLGISSEMRVGDWVLAIGSPFGLGLAQTVTAGIVSGTARRAGLTDYDDFIQTDAAINQGNSGGPLVDLNGKVIGINTWIMSRSGGYDGIGFAIPIDLVKEILPQLLEKGKVRRGKIGVMIKDVSDIEEDKAEYLNIEVDYGAYVDEVIEGDPGEKAGIEPGDVIIEFNGERVEGGMDLSRRAAITPPGTKVKIVAMRNGKRKNFNVTLGEMEDEMMAKTGEQEPGQNDIGITVEDVSKELAEQFDFDDDLDGVVVTEVERDSSAARKGIAPGAFILKINRNPVKSANEFYDIVEKRKQGQSLFMLVYQDNKTRLVAINPDE